MRKIHQIFLERAEPIARMITAEIGKTITDSREEVFEYSAPSWGKAHWIGVAEVTDGEVTSWRIDEVAWDESHDSGTHGSHHARIVRFLKDERIDAVVSVVGGRGLSILYKLQRKGLNVVCIPRSIENDVAATAVSFGFNLSLIHI